MQTYYIPEDFVQNSLLTNENFKNILKDLSLKVINGKLAVTFKDTGNELQIPTLKKISFLMQNIAKDNLPEGAFYEILVNILLGELSFEEAKKFDNQILEYKQSNIYSLETEEEIIKNKIIELLRDLDFEYLTYEKVVNLLKENCKLDISVNDPKLSNILKDLGYMKKRKIIDSKKITIWIKVN